MTKIALEQIIDPVKDELKIFESKYRSQFSSKVEFLQPLLNYLKTCSGKRMRPLLFLLSQGLISKPDVDTLDIAVLLELLHTATLVHDDVVDESTQRRNKKTMNALWGDKTAVLLGDYLFAKVLELGVKIEKFYVLDIIAKVVGQMSRGELRQIIKDDKKQEDIYFQIINEKTACLFGAASMLGGAVKSASADVKNKLKRFGELFGMVFQIRDDILDFSGKSELLGKPAGQDIAEGRFTLPLIIVYNKIKPQERKYMHGLIYGNPEKNKKILIDFVKRHDGIKIANKKVDEISQEALLILKIFDPSPYKDAIEKFFEFNRYREI